MDTSPRRLCSLVAARDCPDRHDAQGHHGCAPRPAQQGRPRDPRGRRPGDRSARAHVDQQDQPGAGEQGKPLGHPLGRGAEAVQWTAWQSRSTVTTTDSGRATATAVRTTRTAATTGRPPDAPHTGGPPGRARPPPWPRAARCGRGAISGSPPGEPGSVDRGRAGRGRGCPARPTGRWARRSLSRVASRGSARAGAGARPGRRQRGTPVAWGITVSSRAGSTSPWPSSGGSVSTATTATPRRESATACARTSREIAGVRTTTRALAGTRRRSWLRSRFSSATVPSAERVRARVSRTRRRWFLPAAEPSAARSRAPRTCRPTRSPVRR